MAQRLFPSLALGDGESPTSFVSRLARLHRAPSPLAFCTDLGFQPHRFVIGNPSTLAHFADLVGVSPVALAANALVRVDDIWLFRGERLIRASLLRSGLRVCPVCLAQDLAASTASPGLSMYGRALWQIGSIRTCPAHAVALTTLSDGAKALDVYDFSARIAPYYRDIEKLAAAAKQQRLTEFETYLLNRLAGEGGGFPWLDGLPFHAAAKTCEMIGAIAARGRTPYLTRFSDDDWRESGEAGFAIAAGGEPAIRAFLTRLQQSYKRALGGKELLNAFYGRLYQWLAGSTNPDFDPLRDLVRRHAIETMPLGPSDTIFGKPVEKRLVHSLYTASVETGVHYSRLQALLLAQGLVSPARAGETPNLVYFDAVAAAPFLTKLTGSMSMKEVETYLGAGRVHTRLLAQAGFIKPLVSASTADIRDHPYARADLDAFLRRLLADTVPVKALPPDAYDIPSAARLANCRSMEIVDLILDRRLAWIGRRVDLVGYQSVLVTVEEIKPFIRTESPDDLSLHQVEDLLQTSYGVVKALLAEKLIPHRVTSTPASKRGIYLVPRAAVEAFQAEYISLASIAAQHRVHIRKMLIRLRCAGIEPALNPVILRARFYRRNQVASG